jgi:glycosyltransferase involved in cell wall biosynthesis
MRILVDATGVNDGGGGICTYFLGLLAGWAQAGFDDEWCIVGMRNLPRAVDDLIGRGTVVRHGNPSVLPRILTQQVVLPATPWRRRWRPDVFLAMTPVIPMVPGRAPTVATVYDLRSLRCPEEFGALNRGYRRLAYRHGLTKADGLVAISAYAASEVAAMAPERRAVARVLTLGADHVDGWARPPAVSGQGITFAHWSNKRPDIAIRAWRLLHDGHPGFTGVLQVVGAPPAVRESLRSLAARLGLDSAVAVHGYLPESDYRAVFASSEVVVMPSSMEGFGLPVAEAQRLGIPVVASAVGGMTEAGGDAALYSIDGTAASFAHLCAEALFDGPRRRQLVADGYEHARGFLWRETAESVRAELERTLSRPGRRRSPAQ